MKFPKLFPCQLENYKVTFPFLVLSQNNQFRRPYRSFLIKNWVNPEFENWLMEDFKISDMGMNFLRVIHTVGTL